LFASASSHKIFACSAKQVRAAGEYVESGNADIRYAIKYQTELRRRYCCCCVIVLVVVAVVLIYLAVTNPRLFKKIK